MNKIFALARESQLARMLIPAGLMMLAAGIVFLIFGRDVSGFTKTSAVVSKTELFEEAYDAGEDHHEATYTVYVNYTAEGKEYKDVEYGIFSGYKEGEKVTICYNPEDPADIAQPGNKYIFPIILIVSGIALIAGGIISAKNAVQNMRKMKKQEEEWANGN